jgi:hypothetical protein
MFIVPISESCKQLSSNRDITLFFSLSNLEFAFARSERGGAGHRNFLPEQIAEFSGRRR